jgi:hypothetical protein
VVDNQELLMKRFGGSEPALMTLRPAARQCEFRGLGIMLLIFSLVHTPLPQPDFHNIRHHDGPGEVCEHHDHLLRWHPGAGSADDVAILHWHWFLPTSARPDTSPLSPGPALHAHVADGFTSILEDGPRILPDTAARWAGRLALCALTANCAFALPSETSPVPEGLPFRSLAFSATFAPRAPLTSLFHRWVC